MKLLELKVDQHFPDELSRNAAHLAIDEVLLDAAEHYIDAQSLANEENQDDYSCESLRIWEPKEPIVVLGRSCKANDEIDIPYCRREKIPVFRRASGGGTIVAGPGCLMYSIIISYQRDSRLRKINNAHQFVLEQIGGALRNAGAESTIEGHSDLTVENNNPLTSQIGSSAMSTKDSQNLIGEQQSDRRKFSGNAMRCKRHHFLYHGTILFNFDLSLITRTLKMPPRQPEYRGGRTHDDFVTNLAVNANQLRSAIINQWSAIESDFGIDQTDFWNEVTTLVDEKYLCDSWNFRH